MTHAAAECSEDSLEKAWREIEESSDADVFWTNFPPSPPAPHSGKAAAINDLVAKRRAAALAKARRGREPKSTSDLD